MKISAIMIFLWGNVLIAQTDIPERYKATGPQPEIGKSLPDFFLNTVTHYKTNTVRSKDFKGKWLFVDFWFTACKSCITAFPKMNELQKTFTNKIDVLLVGINQESMFGGSDIKKVYEGIRERQDLDLISAYDSTLNFRWGIWSMPHIIIVDPLGIVRYITNGSDLTSEKVQKMINGESVEFQQKDRIRPEYDITKFPGSSEDRLVYRSILTKSNGELSFGFNLSDFVKWPDEFRKDGFKITSTPLQRLYLAAYTGKSYWQPGDTWNNLPLYSGEIIEAADSSFFEFDEKGMPPEFRGLYSYNLAIPIHRSRDEAFILKEMQRELDIAFGFDTRIERREMPVWELVIANNKTATKLRTKGGSLYIGDGTKSPAFASGFKARNISVRVLLYHASYYIGGSNYSYFFDATGIKHNIDVIIEADMTDMEDIQRSLRSNGLEFRRGKKEFSVLVIRDPVKKD